MSMVLDNKEVGEKNLWDLWGIGLIKVFNLADWDDVICMTTVLSC